MPTGPVRLDVLRTVSNLRHGPQDPTFRIDGAGALWRTFHTPDGPGLLKLTRPSPAAVRAQAWGAGAGWLIEHAAGLLGAYDNATDFVPSHPVVVEAARRRTGWRIGRSDLVNDALVATILEQKVTGIEAHRSWRELVMRFGTAPPGPAPAGMRVAPDAATWAMIPSWEWHRAGVDPRRAATAVAASRLTDRLQAAVALGSIELDRRLRSLPGIGVWTSAEIRQRVMGDADAVSVGDYHLPATVGWALTGVRVDDAGMLELLAAWPGHRYRVTRLLELVGQSAPRRGPRMTIYNYRSI